MSQGLNKRSVTIAGHRTSFSLEEAFWRELKVWAAEEDCSLNELVARIDGARVEVGLEEGQGTDLGTNLSSALRLAILARLRERLARATSS